MNPTTRIVRRMLHRSVVACLLGLAVESGEAAGGLKTVPLESEKFDEALAGHTVLTFVVLPTGEIGTEDGAVLPAKDLLKHLKRTKAPRDAFYLFWIARPEELPLAKAAIERCSRYGASRFAVRHLEPKTDSGDPGAAAAELPQGAAAKKAVIVVPGQNPKAKSARDEAPTFHERPAALRPPPLPSRVRCQFAGDAAVVAAAERAHSLFLDNVPLDPAWLGESMFLQPGAWKRLRGTKALAGSQVLTTGVQLNSGVIKLEARFLRTPEETMAAALRVRQIVAGAGGGSIRALTAEEMDAWWTFISFDIEEPVFVLETRRAGLRFIVHFNDDGRLALLDELNALPNQSG